MNSQTLRFVQGSQDADGIGGHESRRRDFGQWPAVRTPELELAVGLSFTLETLLVDRAMVPATE